MTAATTTPDTLTPAELANGAADDLRHYVAPAAEALAHLWRECRGDWRQACAVLDAVADDEGAPIKGAAAEALSRSLGRNCGLPGALAYAVSRHGVRRTLAAITAARKEANA